MKKFIPFLLIFAFGSALFGQVQTGNIYGKIVDPDGNPLPGVTITLSGRLISPMTTVTSSEGMFRFLRLDPARDYTIKAELTGFKTLVRENIVVTVNATTELNLVMEPGGLEETIIVTAPLPVVETKKLSVGVNVDHVALQSLPTARDPWVILQMAPGIMVDRENVGGSESGQQSAHFAKGGGSTVWGMDGVVITDPAAVASPSYFDFDAFEEIQITTGGADVTQMTGGIGLNLVTRRGGNRLSVGARFYYVDEKFQADNLTEDLKKEGVQGVNKIRAIKDYGVNVGGPIIKEKLWWWISYGVQDIWTNNIYGAKDDTLLQNYSFKINAQLIAANRLEAFAHIGAKYKYGRDSSYSFPGGYYQSGKYHFGSPIYKIQDDHMFSDNFFVSVRYSFNDAGFNLTPMEDLNIEKWAAYDVTRGIWYNSYSYYRASRPSHSAYLQANYFNDSLLGASHEFKIGGEWRLSNGAHTSTWPGNTRRRYNYNTLTLDITGDNKPDLVPGIQLIEVWRGGQSDNNFVKQYTGYISDTITYKRLNVILGFRFDYQRPWIEEFTRVAVDKDSKVWKDNFDPKVIQAIDKALPGLPVKSIKPEWSWKILSPRLGITYDITGDGKTMAKFSFAQYGEFMGTGWASYFMPYATGGSMNFYWLDNNGNNKVEINELFWRTATNYAPQRVFDDAGNLIGDAAGAYGIMWSGYDINNPFVLGPSRYTVDKNATSQRTTEFLLTLERELLPDLGIAIDFGYRKFDHFNWSLEYDPNTKQKESQAEYIQIGTIPATVGGKSTEEAAGKPYYLRKAGIPYRYFRYLERMPDYYRDWYGTELRVTKRLSHRWMLNGSLTLQMQKNHYGKKGYMNPTNLWAIDNKIYAPYMGGGSGKISIPGFSRILVKLSGLYQLPYDFNISFNFNAREGHLVPHTLTITDYNAPNPYNQSITVYTQEWGKERLPFFWNFDMRIEKAIRTQEGVKVFLSADIFNVLNQNHMNRRYEKLLGTYYPHNGYFAPNATYGLANEVLNPRVARFGIRFEF